MDATLFRKYLPIPDAAAELNISQRYVRWLMANNQLSYVELSPRVRLVERSSIKRFLAKPRSAVGRPRGAKNK